MEKTLALIFIFFILSFSQLLSFSFFDLKAKEEVQQGEKWLCRCWNEKKERGFWSTWPLLRDSHLNFCFQIDVWWENDDVVFLMVMEEKQNKGSSLEVRLGLMGYRKLRSYQILYGSFSLMIGCVCERRRKNMSFWC